MKFSINKIGRVLLAAMLSGIAFVGCSPNEADIELGPAPDASFTVTPVAGRVNRYLVTSTSANATNFKWEMGDGSALRFGTATDTAYFPEAGTFEIKLLAMGRGGVDSAFQTVTVAADDPDGCAGAFAMLTGCGTKTWKLDPNANALAVGPPDWSMVWWGNGPGDVGVRPCQFNDRWTFKKEGKFMEFDNGGDIWIEDEGGAPWPAGIGGPVGCHPFSVIAAPFRAWGSSTTHKFQVIANTKLRVIGTGAFLGMYKAGQTGNAAVPEAAITYDILSVTENKITVRVLYDWGQWRFTLVPA